MIGRRNFLQLAGRAAGVPPSASSPPARHARQGTLRRNLRGAAGGRSRDVPGATAGSGGLTPVASDSTHRSSASGTQLRAGWSPLRPTGVRCCGKEGAAGPDAARRRWRCPKRHLRRSRPRQRGRPHSARTRVAREELGRARGRLRPRRGVYRSGRWGKRSTAWRWTPRRAVVGFSDGASYALSLGPTNGDLFTRVIAFSPGFASPGARRGMPPVFVSHGTRDGVLPIERCSRRIVPRLEREGYEVCYREFDGPHTVPRSIAHEALGWFVAD